MPARRDLIHDELTQAIIGAGIEVHRHLGPGLLESVYETCFIHELNLRGIRYNHQLALPIEYKGIRFDKGYRVDLFIDEKVVVELKAIERVAAAHEAQLLTYMKLLNARVGLIMNFHAPVLKDGITRRVL